MKNRLAKTTRKPKPHKAKATPLSPAEQFSKLWAQVQKGKSGIAKALEEQQALVAQFNRDILPQEIIKHQQVYQEALHLISFVHKKSLTDKQRLNLLCCISENLSVLRACPFPHGCDLASLEAEIEVLTETYCAPEFMPEPPLFASEADIRDFFEAEFASAFNNKTPPCDETDDDQPFGHTHEAPENSHREQTHAAEALFSTSAANKMFRQLAKILHPDLEQDETQKAVKHEAMSNLLTARDKQDVMTIFEMFCQYVGKGLPSFDDAELARLCDLLKQQISTLQRDKEIALYANPLHGVIYQTFYRKNSHHRFMALKNHYESLCSEVAYSQAMMVEVTNLRALKMYLKEREMDFLGDMYFDPYY